MSKFYYIWVTDGEGKCVGLLSKTGLSFENIEEAERVAERYRSAYPGQRFSVSRKTDKGMMAISKAEEA